MKGPVPYRFHPPWSSPIVFPDGPGPNNRPRRVIRAHQASMVCENVDGPGPTNQASTFFGT